MTQAREGNTVKVHYSGTLSNGTVFDKSPEDTPLEFTLGEKTLIAGFEEAVDGMEVGETKKVTLAPEDAYGPRHDEMLIEVDKDQLPDGLEPEIGTPLQIGLPDGQSQVVIISEIEDDTITLDANHPLAGQELTFEITLQEIV